MLEIEHCLLGDGPVDLNVRFICGYGIAKLGQLAVEICDVIANDTRR